ncbi:MAG: nitronate monooxygenase [Thermoanaerobaculia bacterium]|nr:MAG: nitronate monooxygenase [Thermoanaerobaculia bacterium]
MGVGVSNWRLARAVAGCGGLGVVSGTGLDVLFVRRLQDGDRDGSLRRAMATFPVPDFAAEVLERFLRPEGRRPGAPYKAIARYEQAVTRWRQQLTVLANYVEVWLAREGHRGPIGINLLSKIPLPNLASLYGAMLAGVDYVLMGAGIPRDVPRALDELAARRPASLRVEVEGASASAPERVSLDPEVIGAHPARPLTRPRFLAIVASTSLATLMARKAEGRVDGLVIEGPTAGGHNAPPRTASRPGAGDEPVWGERDKVDLDKVAGLGLPFWLAGGFGTPLGLASAAAAGATGVQVGTLFAYCRESGLSEELKREVLARAARGELEVRTDPDASPTGFPFKVVDLPGTLSEEPRYAARRRVCDLGYLRTIFRTDEGLDYRCPAEPVEAYVAKGGERARAEGSKCLCNALLAASGHGQLRPGGEREAPLLTSGEQLRELDRFLAGRTGYSAAEVVDYLLGPGRTSGQGAGPR